MSILLELKWSDLPDAEKFIIEADDRPKMFNPGRPRAQSFRFETENNSVLFYFDEEAEWQFTIHAVRFDGTKYRIKYKGGEYPIKPDCKARLGFNEIPDSFYKRAYLIYGTHGNRASDVTSQPKDVIVLEASGAITDEVAERLKEKVRDVFGKDQKVIVVSDGLKIGFLSSTV